MPAITYDIGLNYDTKAADASLAAFRARVVAQLTDLASKQSKIELFKDLKGDSEQADKALQLIKTRSEDLRGTLAKLGKDDVGFKQLTAEVKGVDKEFRAAEKSANAVSDRIKLLDIDLKKAGVDTANLAAEQLALAAALNKVQAASQVQTARGVLGVTGAGEAQAQILKLTQAYEVLRQAERAGVISSAELGKAQQALMQKTFELNDSQSLLSGNLRQVGVAVVALVGSVAAYTAGIRAAVAAASAYEQGLASVASITTISKRQLDELGAGVLRLAGTIGIDSVAAFKALYNIIGSGVPAENALSVLEASSKAAVAGLTSVESAARISVQILNAYQLQVSQVSRVQDILFQTVRDGVISYEELAEKFGLVLPAARGAGVTLEELSAATVVLTRSGLNAPRAMVALEGAIKQLAAPTVEAASAMNQLGITYNGVFGTLEQLASKNVGPELLRSLIPDVEGQRAVALLISQQRLFTTSLEEAKNAAGATAEAYQKLKDTPEQAYKRFTQEVNNLQIASGKALLEGLLPMLNGVTSLIRTFNELPSVVRGSASVIALVAGALGVAAIAARSITPLLAPMAAGLAQMGASGLIAAGGINAARVALINFLPSVVSGALGYEFGKSFRENDAIMRSFGNSVGLAAGYLVEGASALSAFVAAFKVGSFDATAAALDRLSSNNKNFADSVVNTTLATANLEIQQGKLKLALEASQKAVGDAGAKFRDAFSEIIEAVDKPIAEVNQRINVTSRQIEAAIARFSAAAALSKELYTAQTADIDRALAAQTQSIELSVAKRELTEFESIKRLTEANTKANVDRLAALNTQAAQVIKAFDLESATRIALLKKTGIDTKQLEAEIATSRIALINDLSGKYADYINNAKRAEEGLRDKIKSIDAEIRGIRQQQADFQNKVTASVSGDVLAYYERQSQAESLLAKAQRQNGEEQKQSLQQVITLAGTLGQAVSDNSGRQIEAGRAAGISSDLITRAGNLQIKSLLNQKAALTEAAAAYDKVGKAGEAASVDISEKLNELFPDGQKAVNVQLTRDEAQVNDLLANLQRDVAAQAPLANLKLTVQTALADYEIFKSSVERDKPIAVVQANFDEFKKSYKGVIETLPYFAINVDPKPTTDALEKLAGSVTAFGQNKINLQTNVDEIAGKLGDINRLELKNKQLTIEVNYTYPNGKPAIGAQGATAEAKLPGLASGGLVSRALRNNATFFQRPAAFAKGGFVGRVPGVGNTDSFPALLESGGFVLQKSAVRALASRGIPTSGIFSRGVENGGSDFSLDGFIDRVSAAPVFNRAAPIRAMFEKAQLLQDLSIADLRAKFPAGYIEAGAEVFSRDKVNRPRQEKIYQQYDAARATANSKNAESATALAIATANGIAIPARGLTVEELKGLSQNIEVVEAAKARLDAEAKAAADQAKSAQDAAGNAAPPKKKAEGGSVDGGALVNALLMPGEVVFGPAQTRAIGLRNLMAMNMAKSGPDMNERIRMMVGGMVNAPPIRERTFGEQWARSIGPTIERFNAGGSVSNAVTNSVSNSVNFNPILNVKASSDVDMRQLVRGIVPELTETLRRSGISLVNTKK